MLEDRKKTPSTEITKTPVEGGGAQHPEGLKLWEDRSLAPDKRRDAYAVLVQEKLEAIASAFDRAGEAKDVATQKEIMNFPETRQWMEVGAWLQGVSAEEFCERIDRPRIIGALLGKNFLGAEAWQVQGIDVGEAPPFPDTITKSLLDSDCPLHPGEKIKDTHLLVLIPKTVNGEPYTALKLDELCATRKGTGNRLVYDGESSWQSFPWASALQAESEWVLLPKSDPAQDDVPSEKHFRNKDIAQQQEVHNDHYKEYREVQTVELMTAVLLNDLINGEPRMLAGRTYLRCVEPNACDGSVCVGHFDANGLGLNVDCDYQGRSLVGRALAWKL